EDGIRGFHVTEFRRMLFRSFLLAQELLLVGRVVDVPDLGEQTHDVLEVEDVLPFGEQRPIQPAYTEALGDPHVDVLEPGHRLAVRRAAQRTLETTAARREAILRRL